MPRPPPSPTLFPYTTLFRSRGAPGDDERAEAGDRDRLALTQRLVDADDERAEGAIRRRARAARRLRQDRDQLGLGHGPAAVMTRHTASSKAVGENGFSTTGTSAPSMNVRDSSPAVSPVMKMKRWRSAGSCASACS